MLTVKMMMMMMVVLFRDKSVQLEIYYALYKDLSTKHYAFVIVFSIHT